MMEQRVALIATVLTVASLASANQCTDSCDTRFRGILPLTFCATDGLTYNTSVGSYCEITVDCFRIENALAR